MTRNLYANEPCVIDVINERWVVQFPVAVDKKDRRYATLTNAVIWCEANGFGYELGPCAEAVIQLHAI